MVKSLACYSWDRDGTRYIDFMGANGAYILGAAHHRVTEAVIEQAREGSLHSLPSTLEIEAAERITNMIPEMEVVRFLKTGSEACSAALRIARTWTDYIDVYSEGYHGWHDEFTSLTEPALGVPHCDDHVNITDDPDCSDYISIVEPITTAMSLERKDHLQELRKKTKCLILDEVITGFRVLDYTVANHWKIKPDIICMGKAIANGYPLSIVGGRREVMNSGEYFVSSTFSGDNIALAAMMATIKEITEHRVIGDLVYYADRFQENFNVLTSPIDVRLVGYGTRCVYPMTTLNGALLSQELCRSGILMGKAFFYNFSHMDEGVDDLVLNIVSDIVSRIGRNAVKLEGPLPQEVFKR